MRPSWAVSAVVVLAGSLLPVLVLAEGIGDVAARERARREKQALAGTTEAPTYTNLDLPQNEPEDGKKAATNETRRTASQSDPLPEVSASSGSERGAAEESSEEVSIEQAEVAARERQVAALEAERQELQAKLNPMSGTFIYGGTGSNSPAEEARVRNRLSALEQEIPKARQALDEAREAAALAGRGPRFDGE